MIKDDLCKNFIASWTNHHHFSTQCNPETFSKFFVVDEHQKAHRSVCQYKNVI